MVINIYISQAVYLMLDVYLGKMLYVLETTRLQLRPCRRMEDVLLLQSLWTNDCIRYFLFDNRTISLDEARSFVEDSVTNFEEYGYGLWLIFARVNVKRLVGFAGCLRSEADPSLIYAIHPNFWGYGYATEAANAVLKYMLETLKFPAVKADADEPNIASVRVLEKIGMRKTGSAVVSEKPLVYFEKSHSAIAT